VHEGQAETVWGTQSSRHDNFTARFRAWIKAAYGDSATPETILAYVYAILHSPHYRSEYLAQFSAGFPRIPLPSSTGALLEIAAIGNELIALHLLESPSLANSGPIFAGNKSTYIEKVTWANGSVWIDKAESIGFNGVSEDVWNFRVGGYQVCDKWLKDRKGRSLSDTDISIYRKIVKAIAGTIDLMQKVDRTIDVFGGWLGAFDSQES
jgi:predicted helicase